MDLIVGANQPTNQTALDIDKMKNRPLSQSKKIKEVMLHPSFDKSTVSPMYDLALVEIQGSFTFDKRSVWPICVPDDVRPREDHFYNGYQLVGFGTDTSDSRNCRECLKTDQLNVKTTAFCNDKYKNNQDINFDDEPMICARVTGQSSGSCKGDSGGILWTPVFSSDTGELAVQQAVVRGSVRNCDGSRFPSIFNRLDSQEVLPWIKANVFGCPNGYYRRDDGSCYPVPRITTTTPTSTIPLGRSSPRPPPPRTPTPTPVQCLSTEFACASQRKCIPACKKCNGVNDCGDDSDENVTFNSELGQIIGYPDTNCDVVQLSKAFSPFHGILFGGAAPRC